MCDIDLSVSPVITQDDVSESLNFVQQSLDSGKRKENESHVKMAAASLYSGSSSLNLRRGLYLSNLASSRWSRYGTDFTIM